MSSETKEEKFRGIIVLFDEPFDIKNCIIPFSLFYPQPSYIYSGEEKISFKDRDPLYKDILLREFVGRLVGED
jgi:hypothetical protein